MSSAARAEVVAAAARQAVDGAILVMGDGPLAREIAAALGHPQIAGDDHPEAIVETTGDPQAIQAALERVADLGVVVLAGPAPAHGAALDLYRDLHVRGLTLLGIPPQQSEPA